MCLLHLFNFKQYKLEQYSELLKIHVGVNINLFNVNVSFLHTHRDHLINKLLFRCMFYCYNFCAWALINSK